MPTFDSPVDIFIINRRWRLTDPGGTSHKALVDGIVKAGILRDDSAKEIRQITQSQEKVKAKELESTIVVIQGVNDE